MSLSAIWSLRCLAIAAAVVLLSQSLPVKADETVQAQQLRQTFEAVADASVNKKSASEECLLNLSTGKSASSLRQVAAGFLQESRSTSLVVFCTALVEAVVAGSLKPQTIYEAVAKVDEKTQGLAVGRVLRAAYLFRASPSKSSLPEGAG